MKDIVDAQERDARAQIALNRGTQATPEGHASFSLTPEDEVEVEEAFFRTLALPEGFTAKGGRFFSGFGYLNEVHSHAWDFVDRQR